MAKRAFDPSWLKIVRDQEQILRFDQFTREDALEIGLEVIRLAKEVYHKGVAVYVQEDDVIIFSHKMAGTSMENDWWMRRKLNVSRMTGTSSLLAFLEAEMGEKSAIWETHDAGSVAACGGCFPVYRTQGAVNAYISVSGMHHEEDHQIIVDAVSRHLGRDVCSIIATE